MRTLIALLPLAGCLSEETRLVESWVGVYAIDAYRLDEETCSPEAPDAEPPASHVAVDAVVYPDDPTRLTVRLCDAPDACRGPWLEIFVDHLDDGRVEGKGGLYGYAPITQEEGACSAEAVWLTLTRGNRDQLSVEATILSDERDRVAGEEACVALLDALDETACVAWHGIEASRVE